MEVTVASHDSPTLASIDDTVLHAANAIQCEGVRLLTADTFIILRIAQQQPLATHQYDRCAPAVGYLAARHLLRSPLLWAMNQIVHHATAQACVRIWDCDESLDSKPDRVAIAALPVKLL